jgi:hypothetical protein
MAHTAFAIRAPVSLTGARGTRRCRHAEKEANMLTKLDARSEPLAPRHVADRAVASISDSPPDVI